ncbi:MAG: SDR family NAD(P)-dependent oxidoreductase [Burkholderiales bacterium]
MEKIIILGVSADIGRNICELFHADGAQIIGTYRRDFAERTELEALDGVDLIQCDVSKQDDIERLERAHAVRCFNWTTIFSSVGTAEPIGRFFALDFDAWERSVAVNMTAQLRAIHGLYPWRDASRVVNVALLAGGGTNNPFRCYSAYCVAKIGLIKMCELIDDEAEDVNAFILGPGFVKTKVHEETLRAGAMAEGNLERVRRFVEHGAGTTFEDIYKCLRWAMAAGREVAGGRNFSVVHDGWRSGALGEELKRDRDMFKLRRHRNA